MVAVDRCPLLDVYKDISPTTVTTCGISWEGRGGDLVSIMTVYVCPKVKEMGSFSASSE